MFEISLVFWGRFVCLVRRGLCGLKLIRVNYFRIIVLLRFLVSRLLSFFFGNKNGRIIRRGRK